MEIEKELQSFLNSEFFSRENFKKNIEFTIAAEFLTSEKVFLKGFEKTSKGVVANFYNDNDYRYFKIEDYKNINEFLNEIYDQIAFVVSDDNSGEYRAATMMEGITAEMYGRFSLDFSTYLLSHGYDMDFITNKDVSGIIANAFPEEMYVDILNEIKDKSLYEIVNKYKDLVFQEFYGTLKKTMDDLNEYDSTMVIVKAIKNDMDNELGYDFKIGKSINKFNEYVKKYNYSMLSLIDKHLVNSGFKDFKWYTGDLEEQKREYNKVKSLLKEYKVEKEPKSSVLSEQRFSLIKELIQENVNKYIIFLDLLADKHHFIFCRIDEFGRVGNNIDDLNNILSCLETQSYSANCFIIKESIENKNKHICSGFFIQYGIYSKMSLDVLKNLMAEVKKQIKNEFDFNIVKYETLKTKELL